MNGEDRSADPAKLRRVALKNRWLDRYELKYGVQPIEYSQSGPRTVVQAKCRFCESFGREIVTTSVENTPPSKRRKKRQAHKIFGPNFRSDNLEAHLWREHPRKWHEYEKLQDEDKIKFFLENPLQLQELQLEAQQETNNRNRLSKKKEKKRERTGDTSVVCKTLEAQSSGTIVTADGELVSISGATGNTGGSSLAGGASTRITIEQGVETAKARNSFLSTTLIAAEPASPVRDVDAPNAVLEVLDQLLGLRPADATLQPFVFEYCVHSGELENSARNTNAGQDGVGAEDLPESLLLFTVDNFRAGLSVDAAFAVLQATLRHGTKLGPVVTLNCGAPVTRMHVVRAVKRLMALNMVSISALTTNVWGYSLALHFNMLEKDARDNLTRRGGTMDVRLQFSVANEAQEVHLVTLALPPSQLSASAAPCVGAAVTRILCAVDCRGLEKLIGVTIDGDPYEMGVLGLDIARWLKSQAELAVEISGAGNSSVAAFYIRPSATFLLSLAVDDALAACELEFAFVSSLSGIEAVIKTNKELREILLSDMISPNLGSPLTRRRKNSRTGLSSSPTVPLLRTSWMQIYEQCEKLARHREALMEWQREHHNEAGAEQLSSALLSNVFWVFVFLLRDLLKELQVTLFRCVRQSASCRDVQRFLEEYLTQLRCKFNKLNSPTSSGSDMPATISFTYQDFVSAIIPFDLFMYEAFHLKTVDGINNAERTSIYQLFHGLMVELQHNLESVTVSATPSNGPTSARALNSTHFSITFKDLELDRSVKPPSTPYELMTQSNLAFMDLLNGHQARLRSRWSGKILAQITGERNLLVDAFTHHSALYATIVAMHLQRENGKKPLYPCDAWNSIELEFPCLSRFAAVFEAHLAVSKPTALVLEEESLSTDNLARSASPLTLEAQLHALQLHKLTESSKKLHDAA